jgi:hypothetical protein
MSGFKVKNYTIRTLGQVIRDMLSSRRLKPNVNFSGVTRNARTPEIISIFDG